MLDQRGSCSSIAARIAGSAGSVSGANRAVTLPFGASTNFSKFHCTSGGGFTAMPWLSSLARIAPPLVLTAAGCASTKSAVPIVPTTPAASVQARGETEAVGTANADAADDPAIWRNPANPAASLIVGTDKKAGLHVYDLTGKDRFFIDAGRVNNVDLKDMGDAGVIVAASDRNDPRNAKLALFRLDTATAKLIPLGIVPVGAGEAYGVCLYRTGGRLHAFNVIKVR